LEYIHENPVAPGLVNFAAKSKFSSAKFYLEGIDGLISSHIIPATEYLTFFL